jgi:hypothetical protein
MKGVNIIKLWIDDVRKPPSNEWIWVQSVVQAIPTIYMYERNMHDDTIIIDLDHDAGEFVKYGGDYIEILNWLEREGIVDTGYFFHIHSMNPVGVQNMKAIIEHNGWRLIK